MSNRLLPEPFQDLEPFVNVWAWATEAQRNQHRLTSSMTEIQAFYDTLMPRMEAILSYLSQFPLARLPEEVDRLPEETQRLLYLAFSVVEVATAVELYQQPSVPDGFDPRRFVPEHDGAKR